MSITVVTPTDSRDLTTLEAVKDRLVICDNANDAVLNRLIKESTDYIYRLTCRFFARETVIEKVKGFDNTQLMVSRTPIVSITSITDDNGEPVIDFEIDDKDAGLIYRENGWQWQPSRWFAASPVIVPNTEKKNYTVTYEGGYYTPGSAQGVRDLPYDLESLAIDYVQFVYIDSIDGDPTVKAHKVGDISVTKGSMDQKDSGFAMANLRRKLKLWSRIDTA